MAQSKNGMNVFDLVYPIGSIYLSVSDVNPAALFGGSWERIKDRFLLGAGGSYSAGSTGGEVNHTLTVDEMPSHNHGRRMGVRSTDYVSRTYNGFQLSEASVDTENVNLKITETGGGKPHNNMPPYLAVYIWKRIS